MYQWKAEECLTHSTASLSSLYSRPSCVSHTVLLYSFQFSAHLRITYVLDNFLDSCQFKSTGYDSFVLTQFDKLYVIKVYRVDSFESSEQLVRWSNSAVP